MKALFTSRTRIPAAAGALLVILISGAFLLWPQIRGRQHDGTISPETAAGQSPAPVTRKANGWWESRQRIYYDIPARILFRLPEARRKAAESIAASAWAEFDRIGAIFNPSDPESETSRLNKADKTEPVAVSKDLYRALEISIQIWQASGGAFDPTTGPVKKLWQRAVRTQEIPVDRQIQRALSRTGLAHVTLMDETGAVVCDVPGITFDFGGIAKGLAVDRVTEVLKNAGINTGLVQLGGEIAAFGNKDDQPWKIGIQHPTDMQSIWGTISSREAVHVSTSGNYRQPLIIRGYPFYHIFSPKTGRPVSHRVLGVTTAGFGQNRQNALLDAAATAITVLGAQKGLELAERLGIEALVLTRTDNDKIRAHTTPGFSGYYIQNAATGS